MEKGRKTVKWEKLTDDDYRTFPAATEKFSRIGDIIINGKERKVLTDFDPDDKNTNETIVDVDENCDWLLLEKYLPILPFNTTREELVNLGFTDKFI
jgi:hypothetical protein